MGPEVTLDGPPYPSVNNSVRPVRDAHGTPLVLKEGNLANEQKALRCLNRSVRVRAEAPGVLLLERLDGPTWAATWTPTRDRYDTWRFGRFLRTFHTDRQAELPSPHARAEPLRECTELPKDLQQAALRVFDQAPHPWVVLHGDLHHYNLVRHKKTTVAIDPHGFLGPKTAEVGAFMGNPLKCTNPDLLETRVRVLAAELRVPESEVAKWAFAHASLCWAWSVDDDDPELPHWSGLARYWFQRTSTCTGSENSGSSPLM